VTKKLLFASALAGASLQVMAQESQNTISFDGLRRGIHFAREMQGLLAAGSCFVSEHLDKQLKEITMRGAQTVSMLEAEGGKVTPNWDFVDQALKKHLALFEEHNAAATKCTEKQTEILKNQQEEIARKVTESRRAEDEKFKNLSVIPKLREVELPPTLFETLPTKK